MLCLLIEVTGVARSPLPLPPYSTSGRNIVKDNQVLQLFGFDLSGMEQRTQIILQTWDQLSPYDAGPATFLDVVDQIFTKGFNIVRIPLAVSTIYY
jgi:hypothetical protein